MKKNGKSKPVDKLSPREGVASEFLGDRTGNSSRASRTRAKVASTAIQPTATNPGVDRAKERPLALESIELLLAADAHGANVKTPNDEAAQDPLSSDALDIESLLHRCLNDTTFCTMLLQKFLHRAPDQLSALDRAFRAGNLADLARQAHTLRGLAVNLSAERMNSCATELDRLSRAGELALIGPVVQQMHAEVNRCIAEIPAVIARLTGR